MSYLEAVILAFVEGATEFLPISSTGHLIIVSSLFGINEEGFVKDFNIIIQAGAILSVLVLYWRRFTLKNDFMDFYLKIAIAFLPAAVIGLLVKKKIDLILGSVTVVAWALIIGGVVLILFDRYMDRQKDKSFKTLEQLSKLDCLKIGLIQCLAFIPGVSRAGATMIGGASLGLDKKSAAEFSFFLAVPTLMGAAVVKGHSAVDRILPEQVAILVLGITLAFIFAILAIRFFMKMLEKTGFSLFGYYRIVLGIIMLVLTQNG